ncbi:hypothetical protein GOBAR_DD08020 [Gossypium barbadense]|nr:hypothetical protein GOBAR_DD08020 [Gossypium barbadense]
MEDVDRISDLPDSILTHILLFLSTKKAVGTSILSSRWKYIFTLVPNLHFDLVDDLCHKNLEIRRGVKHLDISISPDQFTSPGIMFTCRSLTTLKLDFTCSVLDVPRGVPFPNLKTLHLKSVEFLSDDTTKCLLSSCNNLEDLVIAHCNIENLFNFTISHHLHDCRLMLDTPNLAYFKYGNLVIAGHPLENLKSINSAFIQSAFSNFRNYATTLFRGISNVHSLVLTYNSLKVSFLDKSLVLFLCEPLPVFATLVELKICDYYREHSMDKGLEILLSSSPELEKLACHQEVLSKLPEKVAYCLLSKLKVMEILGFRNDKDVIEKAKYILKNVGALQKLTIRTLSNISKAKKLKISEVLLGSPRESKHCCILIV